MTLQECIDLAEAHLQNTWLRNASREDFKRQLFSPAGYQRAATTLGVSLPETWLALLPHFIDVVPCNFDGDHHCNIMSAEHFVKYNKDRTPPSPADPPYERMLTNRWVEFGSTDCGDTYTFDLQSNALPKDARVVFWSHETGKEVEAWDSVITFVAEMLGPVSELGNREPRPWQP